MHSLTGIRTSETSTQAAADLCFRPHDHRDQHRWYQKAQIKENEIGEVCNMYARHKKCAHFGRKK